MKKEVYEKIFNKLIRLQNVPIIVQVHKGRKKYIKFRAIINGVYSNVFTLIPLDENKIIQSYSFSDLITKDIVFVGYA